MQKTLSGNLENLWLVCLTAILTIVPAVNANAQYSSAEIGFAGADVCKPGIIDIPQALIDAPDGDPSTLPTNIEADEIATEGENLIILSGNAQVVQGKRGVFADEITYDQESYQATADGNVIFYTSKGDEIRARSLDMEVDTFIGTAEDASIKISNKSPYTTIRQHHDFVEDYSIFSPFRKRNSDSPVADQLDDDTTYVRARGTAQSIDFEGADYELLHDATLTTCDEGNTDVLLVAKEIELDHAAGVGTAKSMKVKFKNIPIFYFPSVTFPINDERKTGFLFPAIGFEDVSGTIIEVPYYINIDANRDATISPRILSNRGVQVYGEYRYLTHNSEGSLRGEFLPSDDIFNDDRYAFSFGHEQEFNDDWDADVDLNSVSDTSYLSDFSSDVDLISSSFAYQRAKLSYRSDDIKFRARISAYDVVNSSVSLSGRPYEKIPELSLDLRKQELGAFAFGIDSEFIDFNHDDSSLVSGTRFRLKPYLSLPLEEIYGYLTPKIAVQSISYSLDNNPTGDGSPSVAVPSLSVDGGLFFERIIQPGENALLQTLEPRLFYVNIPEKLEQESFPDFDSGGGSNSSFGHFFRENRFFGGDRVGDTHQLSVGLTSRIINDETGKQRLKLSLGQVYYFEDRVVGLTTNSPSETENRSDFLAEVTTSLNDDWNARGFARVGSTSDQLEFLQISADYYHSNRRNASVSYSETRDIDEQINLRFETPIGPRWQLEGRADYSIQDSKTRSSLIGITYDGCCWAASIGSQRYLDGTGVYRNRFLLTFELDDLGRISSGR